MEDYVDATRTLLSVPFEDATPVCRAISRGHRIDKAEVSSATHHLADLLDQQSSGGQFVPLRHGPDSVWAKAVITPKLTDPSLPSDLYVEWWTFTKPHGPHHAAVMVYRPWVRRRILPLSLTSTQDVIGTTSQPLADNARENATRFERTRRAKVFRTDYIFGDVHAPLNEYTEIAASTHANGAFAGVNVDVLSGPPIDSPAWRKAPAPLGTDLNSDVLNPDGTLYAEYRLTRNI